MGISLDFDIAKFIGRLEEAEDAIIQGAKTGMHDALDHWQAESRDVAPLDKGTLRRHIQQEPLKIKDGEIVGEISANAIEVTRSGRFNYAYYIHENDAGGGKLRHPGTVKKFLEYPLRKNETKYKRLIEDAIEAEIKRKGLA
ncbi:hypothetical protein XI25_06910 [Paenibacillus sp. DMB20]|nr:hypothetical protein XI25_06910 [Paenibacillus sp. DMB20]